MTNSTFKPGFRLSVLDILVLVAAAMGSFKVYERSADLSFIILFVTGHFFVFCNVVRINCKSELIWAFNFIVLGILRLPIQWHFLLSVTLTVILVYKEFRKPSYHGTFWEKINPNLIAWFEEENK